MSDEQTKATEKDHKKALKASLDAVRETQRLIKSGHFSGNQAAKIIGCLGYLDALEKQIASALLNGPE